MCLQFYDFIKYFFFRLGETRIQKLPCCILAKLRFLVFNRIRATRTISSPFNTNTISHDPPIPWLLDILEEARGTSYVCNPWMDPSTYLSKRASRLADSCQDSSYLVPLSTLSAQIASSRSLHHFRLRALGSLNLMYK